MVDGVPVARGVREIGGVARLPALIGDEASRTNPRGTRSTLGVALHALSIFSSPFLLFVDSLEIYIILYTYIYIYIYIYI